MMYKEKTKTHTPKETKKNSESEIFANSYSEKTWEWKGCKYKPRFPWLCSLVRTQVFIMLVCRRRPFYPILYETHCVLYCNAAATTAVAVAIALCVVADVLYTIIFICIHIYRIIFLLLFSCSWCDCCCWCRCRCCFQFLLNNFFFDSHHFLCWLNDLFLFIPFERVQFAWIFASNNWKCLWLLVTSFFYIFNSFSSDSNRNYVSDSFY